MTKLNLPKGYEPQIIADSTNWTEIRLTTFLINLPTCLLAELRTHRLLQGSDTDLSINANSDRAIPISKKMELVKQNTYLPIATQADKGMTGIENVPEYFQLYCNNTYESALHQMLFYSESLTFNKVSKQYVNRLLMPFSYSEVIVTGDSFAWQDFFRLRTAENVEPNFRYIAQLMSDLYQSNQPKHLEIGEWHYPFKLIEGLEVKQDLIVSMSCCARISFDIDRNESYEKHYERSKRIFESGHVSVSEHQYRVPDEFDFNFNNFDKQVSPKYIVKVDIEKDKYDYEFKGLEIKKGKYFSNVNGWIQLRKMIECKEFKI